ncbi:MAG: hypothetical protein Alpg2KO_06850 [Alphaproteobacteria bacterium]
MEYNRRRGASLSSYGLIVGLISIVALGAVTGIGDNINALFGETGDTLAEVIGEDTGAQSAAAPTPTPNVTNLDFPDITNQPISTQVASVIVQPTVDGTSTMTVSGNGSPQLRTCSDAACSSVLQSYASSVSLGAGEYLQVQVTTPGSQSSSETITVTGGGATATFSVATGSGDCLGANSCAFNTSQGYSGDLGGLSGADAICTNDPNNPGGPAYAILATDGYNHQRGMSLKVPVLRASDNQTIANDENQFFCHQAACGTWTNGLDSSTSDRVWTGVVFIYSGGSRWSGSPTNANCSSWTSASNSFIGNMGRRTDNSTVSKPTVWMEGNHPPGCSAQYMITCVNNVQTPPN